MRTPFKLKKKLKYRGSAYASELSSAATTRLGCCAAGCRMLPLEMSRPRNKTKLFQFRVTMPSALLTLAAVLSAARSSQAAIQLPPVVAGGVRTDAHAVSMRPSRAGRLTLEEKDSAPPAPPGVPPRSSYNLKQVTDKQGAGGGAGFNVGLVDPIASATGFVSRRFGLAGGLAVVGLLAATEGREIVAALLDKGPAPGDGKLVTTPSGLQYVELLIGSGDTPLPGTIVGVDTVRVPPSGIPPPPQRYSIR